MEDHDEEFTVSVTDQMSVLKEKIFVKYAYKSLHQTMISALLTIINIGNNARINL